LVRLSQVVRGKRHVQTFTTATARYARACLPARQPARRAVKGFVPSLLAGAQFALKGSPALFPPSPMLCDTAELLLAANSIRLGPGEPKRASGSKNGLTSFHKTVHPICEGFQCSPLLRSGNDARPTTFSPFCNYYWKGALRLYAKPCRNLSDTLPRDPVAVAHGLKRFAASNNSRDLLVAIGITTGSSPFHFPQTFSRRP